VSNTSNETTSPLPLPPAPGGVSEFFANLYTTENGGQLAGVIIGTLVIGLLILVVLAIIIMAIVRRWRRSRYHGQNPLASDDSMIHPMQRLIHKGDDDGHHQRGVSPSLVDLEVSRSTPREGDALVQQNMAASVQLGPDEPTATGSPPPPSSASSGRRPTALPAYGPPGHVSGSGSIGQGSATSTDRSSYRSFGAPATTEQTEATHI
jgi:hypothetical protein